MSFKLSAAHRGDKGEKTRTATKIPAVVYGVGKATESLTLDYANFLKLHHDAGVSSLIDLKVDGQDGGKILIQEVQRDPVSDRVIHVDLRRIDMNQPVTATVELRFSGESPAIKELGGTLMHSLSVVHVKCLPKDLVGYLEVDLAVLKTFDDVIKIKNLVLPVGLEITSPHAEDLVVKAAAAMTEEEIKKMEDEAKAADVSKIEVAGKKKEEEGEAVAEGVEGAKTAPAGKEEKDKKEEKK
ncbi:MAG: 50S ribosomal protein L25 [Patescibacteria group bacterium]